MNLIKIKKYITNIAFKGFCRRNRPLKGWLGLHPRKRRLWHRNNEIYTIAQTLCVRLCHLPALSTLCTCRVRRSQTWRRWVWRARPPWGRWARWGSLAWWPAQPAGRSTYTVMYNLYIYRLTLSFILNFITKKCIWNCIRNNKKAVCTVDTI